MSSNKTTLFSDESDDCENEVFKINKNYANFYENFRKKEELQKLKDLELQQKEYDDSDGSSSEDSDKPTAYTMESFATALEAVRAGKTEQVAPGDKFLNNKFDNDNESGSTKCQNNRSKKSKSKEVYTLEAYMREQNKRIEQGEDYLCDEPEPRKPRGMKLDCVTLEDEMDGSDSDDDILLPKADTTEKKQINVGEVPYLQDRLSSVLFKPNMSEDDRWLAEYFLSKNAEIQGISDESKSHHGDHINRDNCDGDNMHGFVYEDEEEHPTIAEKLSEFASSSKYSVVSTKPTFVKKPSTLRNRNTKRTDERIKRKHRKEAEKEKIRQEVHQLMAIKKKDILDKLAKIKEISGQEKLAFGEADLDEEFDPDKHDRKMDEMYSDQYYGDADLKKPHFEYDEDIDGDIVDYDDYAVHTNDGDGEEENCNEEINQTGKSKWAPESVTESANYPDESNEAEGYVPRKRRRGKKPDKLSRALRRRKPVFDSSQHVFDEYFDEYYGLDFEDIIAGDIKCRFKYKQVEPNNFGLSTDEILCADDKELNRWYSLRKLLKNDRTSEQEAKERKMYNSRANNEPFKRKMLPTLYTPPEEDLEDTIVDEAATQRAEEEKKKRKNLKKKLRKQKKAEENGELVAIDMANKSNKIVDSSSKEGKLLTDNIQQIGDTFAHSSSLKRLRCSENVHSTGNEPLTKKAKHSSITVHVPPNLQKKFSRNNKPAVGIQKKVKTDRMEQHRVVQGEEQSNFLKLNDSRLAVLEFTNLSKQKRQARFKLSQLSDKPLSRGHEHNTNRKGLIKSFAKNKKHGNEENRKKSFKKPIDTCAAKTTNKFYSDSKHHKRNNGKKKNCCKKIDGKL